MMSHFPKLLIFVKLLNLSHNKNALSQAVLSTLILPKIPRSLTAIYNIKKEIPNNQI